MENHPCSEGTAGGISIVDGCVLFQTSVVSSFDLLELMLGTMLTCTLEILF